MVRVGEIRELKAPIAGSVYGLVLSVDRVRKAVLLAMVSRDSTPNCSQICIGPEWIIYPAIQGTMSVDSLSASNSKSDFENVEKYVSLVFGWPAMSESEKKDAASRNEGVVRLGNSSLSFSPMVEAQIDGFAVLSHGYFASSQLGVQWHESLLPSMLRDTQMLKKDFLRKSFSAIYATNSFGAMLRDLPAETLKNDSVRLAIRQAVDLRSMKEAKPIDLKENQVYGRYFHFMRELGIYSMTLVHSNDSNVKNKSTRRVGPYTIHALRAIDMQGV